MYTPGGGVALGGGTVSTTQESISELGKRLMMPNKVTTSHWWLVGLVVSALALVSTVSLFVLHRTVPGAVGLVVMFAGVVFTIWRCPLEAKALRNREEVQRRMEEKWQKLFYCHRCDRVFFEGEKKVLPPERMEELLSRC